MKYMFLFFLSINLYSFSFHVGSELVVYSNDNNISVTDKFIDIKTDHGLFKCIHDNAIICSSNKKNYILKSKLNERYLHFIEVFYE